MSENKHTPEPWPVFSDLSWDDYFRARACVNACPGIETQDLEALRGTSILAKANASFDTVQKQRDELLADRDTWKARAEFSYQQRDVLEGRASLAEAQRDELLAALEFMLERISEPPEANCSCHLSPPCNDCIDFGGEREAFEEAKSAIARAKGGAA